MSKPHILVTVGVASLTLTSCSSEKRENEYRPLAKAAADEGRPTFTPANSSFSPAKAPQNLSTIDPTNRATHELSYCVNVEMAKFYNDKRGAFSKALLKEAATEAVETCDRYVDGATQDTMKLAKAISASTNPEFSKQSKRLAASLENSDFAKWRASEVKKAIRGASSYVRGIQISTQPAKPDKSGSAVAQN